MTHWRCLTRVAHTRRALQTEEIVRVWWLCQVREQTWQKKVVFFQGAGTELSTSAAMCQSPSVQKNKIKQNYIAKFSRTAVRVWQMKYLAVQSWQIVQVNCWCFVLATSQHLSYWNRSSNIHANTNREDHAYFGCLRIIDSSQCAILE